MINDKILILGWSNPLKLALSWFPRQKPKPFFFPISFRIIADNKLCDQQKCLILTRQSCEDNLLKERSLIFKCAISDFSHFANFNHVSSKPFLSAQNDWQAEIISDWLVFRWVFPFLLATDSYFVVYRGWVHNNILAYYYSYYFVLGYILFLYVAEIRIVC